MTQDDVIHVICCLGCLFTSPPSFASLTRLPSGPLPLRAAFGRGPEDETR